MLKTVIAAMVAIAFVQPTLAATYLYKQPAKGLRAEAAATPSTGDVASQATLYIEGAKMIATSRMNFMSFSGSWPTNSSELLDSSPNRGDGVLQVHERDIGLILSSTYSYSGDTQRDTLWQNIPLALCSEILNQRDPYVSCETGAVSIPAYQYFVDTSYDATTLHLEVPRVWPASKTCFNLVSTEVISGPFDPRVTPETTLGRTTLTKTYNYYEPSGSCP